MLNKLLRRHNLAQPSSILANPVALRLAQMTSADFCDYDFIRVSIPLREKGRQLEISSWFHKGSLRDWRGHVGMPGEPRYRSVYLQGEDKDLVGRELLKLWHRIREGRAVAAQSESEHNAIDMIEAML